METFIIWMKCWCFFLSVIYDGCPKTITQGIWWPRTKFNLPAAVPCPKGSVGLYTLVHTNMTVLHTHWCSRWPSCPPPCRCSHQTLWCGAGVAGAWSVQLHLSSVCGAQCCCMWSNTLTHTQPPESVTLLSATETREDLSTCSVQLWTVSWGMNEGGFLLITAFLCVSRRSTHFLLCVSRVVHNNQTNNQRSLAGLTYPQ